MPNGGGILVANINPRWVRVHQPVHSINTTDAELHLVSILSNHLWPRQYHPADLELGIWAVSQIERIVADEHRESCLCHSKPNQYPIHRHSADIQTLNSATAKPFPKHVLGPSMKVNR